MGQKHPRFDHVSACRDELGEFGRRAQHEEARVLRIRNLQRAT